MNCIIVIIVTIAVLTDTETIINEEGKIATSYRYH